MSSAWSVLAAGHSNPRGQGDLATRQWRWLKNCLARNRDTEFGRRHLFAHVDSIDTYRKQVPLQAYEDCAADISRMAQGQADILFAGQPLAFERTGGSSGGSKLIPYSEYSLADFRAALLPWLGDLVTRYGIDSGCAYWAISPAMRQPEQTGGGCPIGLADGAYLGEHRLQAFAEVSCVPHQVGNIETVSDWELATLYWLVRRRDLALISVWSPTFFLRLLDGLDRRGDELAALLANGGTLAAQALPADSTALQRLSACHRSGNAGQLWPALKLISCWTDAASRPYADELQARLPGVPMQGKGLLATEGVTTVPDREDRPLLAADSGFYEFLDDDGKPHDARDLQAGDCYEVVMTTAGGLYRYRSGDRVRCKGFSGAVPVLAFIGRSGLVSDLVGEKLTEAFVTQCLQMLPGFRMLVPVGGDNRHYALVMDHRYRDQADKLLPAVESELMSNPQYAYARKLGQLGKLTLRLVDDPLGRYLQHAAGQQRLGDIKIPALCPPNAALQQQMAGAG